MSGNPPDMTLAQLNCLGYANCIYNCLPSQSGNVGACQTMCDAQAKPGTSKKWIDAALCGQDYCLGSPDAGTSKCVDYPVPASMGGGDILCDPTTTYAECSATTYMSMTCTPCLEQARNFWIYDASTSATNPGPPTGMCPDPTNADCIAAKAACATKFNDCLNDL